MSKNKKWSLLIVDDQVHILTTLRYIFEDNGFEVDVESNPLKAIEKLKKKKVDMALLDINMPQMDGLETFRKIKQISPSTVVVMMTGNKANDQIDKSLEEGAFTVVFKPVDIENLIKDFKQLAKNPVILVVDDRKEDRTILKENLKSYKYSVVEAEDGREALEKIKNGNFDLCLIDYRMPGLNGLEVVKNIKKVKKDIGIILMSGYSLEGDTLQEIDEKGLSFIKKPYNIEKLIEDVTQELEAKK